MKDRGRKSKIKREMEGKRAKCTEMGRHLGPLLKMETRCVSVGALQRSRFLYQHGLQARLESAGYRRRRLKNCQKMKKKKIPKFRFLKIKLSKGTVSWDFSSLNFLLLFTEIINYFGASPVSTTHVKHTLPALFTLARNFSPVSQHR